MKNQRSIFLVWFFFILLITKITAQEKIFEIKDIPYELGLSESFHIPNEETGEVLLFLKHSTKFDIYKVVLLCHIKHPSQPSFEGRSLSLPLKGDLEGC